MKLKLIASLLVGVVLSVTALADTLKLRADHPETYIVKKGDTLWDISALFLNSPWLWPRLWENNSQIENPHLIYPGDVLNLIWVDGEPRLSRKRLKKLSPTPRIEEKGQAIPIIPLNRLSAFLTKDHIIAPELVKDSPKVLGDAVGSPRFFEGDIFYGQGQFDENKLYGIYRLGDNFKGKYSENLGSELLFIGQAQVSQSPNVDKTDKATPLSLIRSSREARQGDLILPIPEYETLPAYFIPKPVSKSLKGRILSSFGPSAIGKWDVVVIDKGSRDDVEIGSMFSILRSGQAILVNDDIIYQDDGDTFDQIGDPDLTLPAERVGELMVFKVYEKLSIAILMRGTDVIGSTYKIEGLAF